MASEAHEAGQVNGLATLTSSAHGAAAPKDPHALPVGLVLSDLAVTPEAGLAEAEARDRLAQYGANVLVGRRKRSAWQILLAQVQSLIVWLLAFAAGLSMYLGDLTEAAAIVVVLAINTAIGFFTELRAVRSMEALRSIAQVRTRVRREGTIVEIDAREVVPGDIVVIEGGDVITADLRLIEAAGLQCDESLLTGESMAVEKSADPVPAQAVIGDRFCMGYKGTAVVRGSALGVAVATGMGTELGHISRLTDEAQPEVSPLEKRLDRLGQALVWLTLGLAAAMIVAGVARGRGLFAMVETGIALAVAAIPEGLPIVATLCLARGAWRMARQNALISKLSAVQTLGATTLILTDKTGTLTQNRMSVATVLLADRDVELPPPGRAEPGPAANDQPDEPLHCALRIGVLCSNAELAPARTDGVGEGTGDAMELALLAVAERFGVERRVLLTQQPELVEHAFDSATNMMATVHRAGAGVLFAVKGAPEQVIARAGHVLTDQGIEPLDATAQARWLERARGSAQRGHRVLALAMRTDMDAKAPPYVDLTLVGLASFLDPLRPDVPDAIAACREAGVRVVMLTGDHAATAAQIARDARLGREPLHVIEGHELEGIDVGHLTEAQRERLRAADVFARVSPQAKLALATLHQRAGEIVAMTGDGVNDAPALRKADIGIAMGQRGTQVARDAADMVLKDDAFPTLVSAMREGRVIFANIRRFIVYLLSCNVSEVLVVGLAVTSGLPMPLLPLQILFLNLVTDVFPAFALGLGEGDETVMRRPPHDPAEPIVDRARWLLVALLGGAITVSTLGSFAIALYGLGLAQSEAVTVSFVTLSLAQLWNVFNMRNAGAGILANDVARNPWVWAAVAACAGMVGVVLAVPGLAHVLQLPPPGAAGLALALLASIVPLVIGQWLLSLRWRALASLRSA